jgi:hypothetical protein
MCTHALPGSSRAASFRGYLSKRLLHAVKTSGERQYRLAQKLNMHPSTLSCWVNGIVPVPVDDPRILELGALLGLAASECFEKASRPAAPEMAAGAERSEP